MKTRSVAGFGLLLFALVACGQVGPLYLPKEQAATEVPAAPGSGDAAAPAPTTGTPPAADAPGPDAGNTGTDGVGVGTDNRGTGDSATVPDRTNEPRRRAH